jgi:DNA polymerase-3 subunit epsilon
MILNLTRPVAFFDLETTGLNVASDRIVEIAVLKIHPAGLKEKKEWRLNPGIPISPESALIHGINDEDVIECPSFGSIAGALLKFLEHADLGGYNCLKFDIPMLVEEFLRCGYDFDIKGRKCVDVQNIFHQMEQRTLKAAYKFYCGKDLANAHNAMADIDATYEILLAQLEKYKDVKFTDKTGTDYYPVVNDFKALHDFTNINRNADLAGRIIYNDKGEEVFNFGKHNGKRVVDVLKAEPSYYAWIQNGDFPLYTKKILTSIKLREFNNK